MVSEKRFNIEAGDIRVFNSDFAIKGITYVRMFLDALGDDVFTAISVDEYDIINDNVVFETAPTGKVMLLQVATTPSELLDNPTDIAIVAGSILDVNIVAEGIEDVVTVSGSILDVVTVSGSIVDVNTVSNNVNSINIVADSIASGSEIGGDNNQFIGTGLVKGIQAMAQTSSTNDDMTVTAGTNAFSVDSYTLEDGATLTIEDGATYTIL